MKAIAIFTLVICFIGVEPLPGLINSPTDLKAMLPVEVDISDLVSNFNVRFQALGDNVTRLGDQLRIVEEENARVQNALKEKVAGLETKLQTSMEEADGLREQLKASNEQNSKVDDLREQLKASIEQKGVREKLKTTNRTSGLFFVVPRTKSLQSPRKVYKVFFDGFSVSDRRAYKGLMRRNGTNDLSWQEARVACQDLGGDLAQPSTREEEDEIMAAFGKAPEYINSEIPEIDDRWHFWIGAKKEGADIAWVSGKKIELDSDLKFAERGWKDPFTWGCGSIRGKGISFYSCSKVHHVGHVCEFYSASPICIQ